MNTNIIMYGADWCHDCMAAKAILEEKKISYELRDITDPIHKDEYIEKLTELNDGKRIIPTFVIGGNHYPNPKPSELHNLLEKIKNA
ncbi:MAG: glutaredoxin family protein [Candidatus Pacebacteria bacterium]|nr:glutaredoxin family protein [Candidatus Paceibacterota bacterium]